MGISFHLPLCNAKYSYLLNKINNSYLLPLYPLFSKISSVPQIYTIGSEPNTVYYEFIAKDDAMPHVRLKLTRLIRSHQLKVNFKESSSVVSRLGGGGEGSSVNRGLDIESVKIITWSEDSTHFQHWSCHGAGKTIDILFMKFVMLSNLLFLKVFYAFGVTTL